MPEFTINFQCSVCGKKGSYKTNLHSITIRTLLSERYFEAEKTGWQFLNLKNPDGEFLLCSKCIKQRDDMMKRHSDERINFFKPAKN